MAHGIVYVRLMNSAEWQRIRAKQLHEHPYCSECLRRNIVREAEVVHHVQEVESGRTEEEMRQLAYSFGNLQSLCRKHHNALHAEKKSHSRKVHKEREKSRLEAWMERQRGNVQNGPF